VGIRKAATVSTIATIAVIAIIAVIGMVGTGATISGDTLRAEFVPNSAAMQVSDSQPGRSPIPEPAALSLLGLGFLVVGRTVRARQRS
jgi:hypothetical protein